jgi:hypothetical protein
MQLTRWVVAYVPLLACSPPPTVEADRSTSASVATPGPASASTAASASATEATNAPPARVFATRRRTLDCGNYFGCKISGEKLACWGMNQFGQLGKPATKQPRRGHAFVEVPSPVAVGVGLTHGCALTGSGDVYCWGASSDGALGDGVLNAPEAPTRVIPPTKVAGLGAKAVDLDVGNSHSCAALEDGAVACWGANYADVLGPGAPSSAQPVRIAGVQGAVEVATSDELSCARTSVGEVACWGRGKAAPERVAGACAQQLTIAVNGVCAVDCSGAVSCWGDLPGYENRSPTPAVQPRFADVEEIRGGLSHFVARDRSGRVLTWGGNDSGQIGNGKPASWSEAFADEPVVLSTSWKANAVCAGGIIARPDGRAYLRPSTFVDTGISCAATPTDEVYCWGEPDLDYTPKPVQLPKP